MSYAHSAKAVFINMLGTLDLLVGKAEDAGMHDSVLREKLADDMFPLELQFRADEAGAWRRHQISRLVVGG